jgi:hypothetical protein
MRQTEKSVGQYTGRLKDDTSTAVPGSALSVLQLTLKNKNDGAVINGRSAQNALNTNNVTVDEAGLLTWKIQALDNVIVDDTLKYEDHIALFHAEWGSNPLKQMNHEVTISVRNLALAT